VQSIRDTGADVLAVLAAAVHVLGFSGAVHAASGRLVHWGL
jgi:hypothetical protein